MRRYFLAVLLVGTSVISGVGLAPSGQAATVGLSDRQTGRIVSDNPADFTPHALNGTVNSIIQIGDQIVVGGTFTSVRSATSTTTITRNRVFAFNATTGVINTNFNPSPNGTVYKVQQTPDPDYVFVAGQFTSAGGSSRNRIFKINVNTGVIDNSFTPASLDGQVRDLDVVGNRLWVGGKFTHVGGRAQRALTTLNATTGAYDPYFTGTFAGTHRTNSPGDTTSVLTIGSNPQNTELVVGGNFTTLDNQARVQIAKLDITDPTSYSLADWATNQYTDACRPAFESYVFDISYSPDGDYFAVATTGGYGSWTENMNGTSGCDLVARYETSASGPSVRPTWTAYTGGDTTWTIEVTDGVIYAGGHQRYQNNPAGNNMEGQGAVARTGIAALNPVNGMPWSWNPTRTRGVGVQDMLATPQGLWVGSDTDRIGNYEYHARIALLPLAGGKTLPDVGNATLPNTVYNVPSGGSSLSQRTFDGTTPGSVGSGPSAGGPTWGSTVGSFMVNDVLYTASSDGSLAKRPFDGTSFGGSTPVNAADQIIFQTAWHNEVPSITSLFYYDGEIFYTRSGQSQLYRRGFEPESDVVGQQVFGTTVSGFTFSGMRGAFVANDKFYYATTSGQLFRADWGGRAPVPGTAVQVSGPGKDSQNWASRDLFVYEGTGTPPPPPGNSPPTAVINVSCAQLTCNFTSNGSDDSDGTITDYLWDFGDGDTSTAADPGDHTYAGAGPRTVTLTVTDNDGDSTTAQRSISPTDQVSPVTFVASNGTNANRTTHTVIIPTDTRAGDAMVLFFTANTTTPTYSAPAGWTQLNTNQTAGGVVGRAYYKVATSSDHDSMVTITSSAIAKSDMAVSVYRGTDGTTPVAVSATTNQTATTAAHTSPTVNAPSGSKWLVTYWADKSSATSGWAAPAGQQQRGTRSGTSGGHISSLLVDSGDDVSGSTGGLTATANSPANVAYMASVVLQ